MPAAPTMKIGVDAHLVKARPTGVGKAIARTIEAMVDGTAADEFVVYANRQFPRVLDGRPHCRVVRTPLIAASRVLRVLDEQFRMPGRVRRDGIDVFLAPGYVFPGEVGVPMVLGIFDLIALKDPQRVKPETAWYYKLALPVSARRADLVIAPTRAVADDIERLLAVPRRRIRVVPLAADDRFRQPPGDPAAVAATYGIRPPYVLFVGNIEPNKNLDTLVEAFFAARLNAKLPHSLVIAGKKRHRARAITRLIRALGCEADVRLPGYVADEDLPALYAGADVFVYPSHAEGFGIPPLEAMLCGTATITSQDPAVVEVTGDGALHFPAENVAALREALETVLTRPDAAADLAARGRRTAETYSWAETGRRTLEVLDEAAESTP